MKATILFAILMAAQGCRDNDPAPPETHDNSSILQTAIVKDGVRVSYESRLVFIGYKSTQNYPDIPGYYKTEYGLGGYFDYQDDDSSVFVVVEKRAQVWVEYVKTEAN